MALPDTHKLTAGTGRTTGISAEAIAAGANFLGSAIDNGANLDALADIEVAFTCGSAPTAGLVLEVYLLYSLDGGTNYEDGSSTVDPQKAPVGVVPARAVTTEQRVVIEGVELRPHPFKVLVKSELNQSATTTVTLETSNRQTVD